MDLLGGARSVKENGGENEELAWVDLCVVPGGWVWR